MIVKVTVAPEAMADALAEALKQGVYASDDMLSLEIRYHAKLIPQGHGFVRGPRMVEAEAYLEYDETKPTVRVLGLLRPARMEKTGRFLIPRPITLRRLGTGVGDNVVAQFTAAGVNITHESDGDSAEIVICVERDSFEHGIMLGVQSKAKRDAGHRQITDAPSIPLNLMLETEINRKGEKPQVVRYPKVYIDVDCSGSGMNMAHDPELVGFMWRADLT